MASSIFRNSAVPSRATKRVSGLSYLLAACAETMLAMTSIINEISFFIVLFLYCLIYFLHTLYRLQSFYYLLKIRTVVYKQFEHS